MLEFIPLVLALVLADLYPLGIEPVAFDPWITLASVVGFPAIVGLSARAVYRRAEVRWAVHGDPGRYALECHRAGLRLRLLVLSAFTVQVFVLHWRHFVDEVMGLGGVPFLDRAGAITPALALLVALWIAAYPVDRRLRRSTWTLAEYLDFRARSSLGTILLPILFMSSAIDAASRWRPVERWIAAVPSLEWGVVALVVLGMYTFAPIALRAVWRARPLAAGPLRARLEEVGRRAGFRCRDLLVWNSGGGRVANALVIGLVGPLRYVIFTDALLAQLTLAELEAVYGHEIGHVKHHHLPLYFGFSVSLILFLVWFDATLGPWIAPAVLGTWGAEIAGGVLLLAILAGVGVLFGYVSRRFERQADLFGAAVTGDPAGFAAALAKIGALNGIPTHASSWRYFSIDRRIHDVCAAAASPHARVRIETSTRKLVAVLVAFYAFSLVGALRVAAAENGRAAERIRRYGALELARVAWEHYEEGKLDLARLEIEAALVDDGSRAAYLVVYGEILRRQGEETAARAAFGAARMLKPASLWERQRIERGLE